MAFSWTFGEQDSGLYFTIEFDGTYFTVTMLEGAIDLNALWISDGNETKDTNWSLPKKSSLNMDGTKVVWDDFAVLSETGLKKGQKLSSKDTYISASDPEPYTISLAELEAKGWADFVDKDPNWSTITLGVRATSVTGAPDGATSIKYVAEQSGGEPTRTRIFVLAEQYLTGASTTGYTIDGSGGAAFVDIDADGLLDANEINTSNIARFGAGGNVNLGSGSYDIEFIRTGGASAFIDFTGFGADDSIVVNYTQEWAGSGMPTAKSQLAILQRGKFEAISPTPGMGGKFSGYTYSSYTKRLLSTPGVGAFIRGQTAIKSIAGSGTEIALKIGINGNLNAGTLWAYFTNFGVIPGRLGAALLLAVNLSDPSVQPSQISVVWPDTYPPV